MAVTVLASRGPSRRFPATTGLLLRVESSWPVVVERILTEEELATRKYLPIEVVSCEPTTRIKDRDKLRIQGKERRALQCFRVGKWDP